MARKQIRLAIFCSTALAAGAVLLIFDGRAALISDANAGSIGVIPRDYRGRDRDAGQRDWGRDFFGREASPGRADRGDRGGGGGDRGGGGDHGDRGRGGDDRGGHGGDGGGHGGGD